MTYSPTRSARGLAVRVTAALFALIGGLVLSVLASAPAQAADYRYWTFWTGAPGGTWTFAQKGAADIKVTDQFVEGWRFTISPASGGAPQPRMTPTFDTLCPNTPAVAGKDRVAVVIDYGVVTEAPSGETPPAGPVAKCVTLAPGASAADALAAAAVSVRASKGLVCGIDGYPAKECGVAVTPVPTTSESPIPGGLAPTKAPVDASGAPNPATTTNLSPWPYALGAAGFAGAIVLVSWLFLRKRKEQLGR